MKTTEELKRVVDRVIDTGGLSRDEWDAITSALDELAAFRAALSTADECALRHLTALADDVIAVVEAPNLTHLQSLMATVNPPLTVQGEATPMFNIDRVGSPGVYDAQDLTGNVTRLTFQRDVSGLLYAMLGEFKMHASSRAAQRYRFRYVEAEPDSAVVKQSLTTEAPFTPARPDREGMWEYRRDDGCPEPVRARVVVWEGWLMVEGATEPVNAPQWSGFEWRFISPLPEGGEGDK